MKKRVTGYLSGTGIALAMLLLANAANATITYNVTTTYEVDPTLNYNYSDVITFQTNDTCWPACGVSDIIAGSIIATFNYSTPDESGTLSGSGTYIQIDAYTPNIEFNFSDKNVYEVADPFDPLTYALITEAGNDFLNAVDYVHGRTPALVRLAASGAPTWSISGLPSAPAPYPTAVPEPPSLGLLGIGLVGLGVGVGVRRCTSQEGARCTGLVIYSN
jgi:hypothetical protein